MDVIIEQYFDLDIITDNFSVVLDGFWQTLLLSVIGGALSLVWGLVLALMRQAPGKAAAPIRGLAIGYIDTFRGIPLLLIMLLVSGGFGALAADGTIPESIGIPRWFGKPDPFWYGIIAITITYGAYMAEVYRAGIEAVPGGQMEAARSLGMSHTRAMVSIVIPQAFRIILPPLTNELILLTKDSSLVYLLGVTLPTRELAKFGRDSLNQYVSMTPILIAGLAYLIITVPLGIVVRRLEAQQAKAR
jgi:polar amino acid transport system permease protein